MGGNAMSKVLTVATAPKTAVFQMRINPEIKNQLEEIYAASGLTITDAINVFFQQSLNVKGLPFFVVPNNAELLREQAIRCLMRELEKADLSIECEADWVDSQDAAKELGIIL